MASNHTENYGLNQWEHSDKVQMEDFNADNAKIDAAITALAGSKAEQSALTALQTEVAKKAEQSALAALQTTVNGKASQSALTALQTVVTGKGNCRIETGSYVGTGVAPVSIKTSFPPQVFIAMGAHVGVAVRSYNQIQFINTYARFGAVTWRNDGLSWTPTVVATEVDWLNQAGTTYYYAVFG